VLLNDGGQLVWVEWGRGLTLIPSSESESECESMWRGGIEGEQVCTRERCELSVSREGGTRLRI
jgi:hypothetical protein